MNYGPDAGKLATIIDIVDGNGCRELQNWAAFDWILISFGFQNLL